ETTNGELYRDFEVGCGGLCANSQTKRRLIFRAPRIQKTPGSAHAPRPWHTLTPDFADKLWTCDCLDGQRVRHLRDLFRWIVAGVASFCVSRVRGSRERTMTRNILRVS